MTDLNEPSSLQKGIKAKDEGEDTSERSSSPEESLPLEKDLKFVKALKWQRF